MMTQNLTKQQELEFLKRGFTRRNLGRIGALLGVGATLPFYNEPALAQLSNIGPLPSDAVKINANENPLGPCPEAAEAIYSVVKKGGRYMYEETFGFAKTLSEQEGLKPNYVTPYPGSSEPLHRAVLAYTSPSKSMVMGDPGYEAGQRAAAFVGAKVHRVPLTKNYTHDVKAMVAADPNAGLFYICNPNNPTGTVTPKSDIEWLVKNKPAGSILLLDEAYIHLSEEPFGTDFVGAREGRHRSANLLEALRHGWIARGRGDWPARSAREASILRRRRAPGDRHGGRQRQLEGQDAGSGTPEDYRRHPHRRF